MIDSSLITFVALVLFSGVAWIYLRPRARTMSCAERIGLVGLAFYFPFVLGLTLGGIPIEVGRIPLEDWGRWVNLIPFGTVGPQMAADLEIGIRHLVGNLLLLLPLGFGLPVVSRQFRRIRSILLVAFLASAGIEISQATISVAVGVPYRAFDVDDLILNTAGAMIGWFVWRFFRDLAVKRVGRDQLGTQG